MTSWERKFYNVISTRRFSRSSEDFYLMTTLLETFTMKYDSMIDLSLRLSLKNDWDWKIVCIFTVMILDTILMIFWWKPKRDWYAKSWHDQLTTSIFQIHFMNIFINTSYLHYDNVSFTMITQRNLKIDIIEFYVMKLFLVLNALLRAMQRQ